MLCRPPSSSLFPYTTLFRSLTITKTHNGSFSQGQSGKTYTITVTNSGAAATQGLVTVTDVLPSGLTATAIGGTGWTCAFGSTSSCTRSDALASGSSYPDITLTVTVANNAPANITNNVTVAGGGEVNRGNSTGSDQVAVAPLADLTITMTHNGSFTQGDTGRSYTMIIRNPGGQATVGTV